MYVAFYSMLRQPFFDASSLPDHSHSALAFGGRGTSTGPLSPGPLTSSSASELCLLLFPLRILKLGHQLPLVPTRAGVVGVGSSFSLGTTFPASGSWEQRQEPEVRWLEA